jgi:hypothetical protein
MKVRKFVYAPVERGMGYMPGISRVEIRIEIEGQEYGYASTVSDHVPFHIVKREAFRSLGAEIARKLEAQV